VHAKFIEPILLERCSALPESDAILIELKLDGFRAIAFKTGGKAHLRSRNDGEIVALDAEGRPSFNTLQN